MDHYYTIEACDMALAMFVGEQRECEAKARRREIAAETAIVKAIRGAAATAGMGIEDVTDLVERLRATAEAIHENAKSA
jgi:hypothetical protein